MLEGDCVYFSSCWFLTWPRVGSAKFGRPVGGKCGNQSIIKQQIKWINQPIKSIYQIIKQKTIHSTNQPISQSINRSHEQKTTNQSIHQPMITNQPIIQPMLWWTIAGGLRWGRGDGSRGGMGSCIHGFWSFGIDQGVGSPVGRCLQREGIAS